MTAYYNEIDPFAAQWIRNLIKAGLIADGEVDERSIEDVAPNDVRKFTQCHFFAGIGVWSYSLRRANWSDDQPVWTGSCPCQPFSAAGKGDGLVDERHLWPAFFHLIKECNPAFIFGEQVASKYADVWVDLVQNDLEAVGYAFGAVPFPSASVGAPHIRDRLYWVADSESERWNGRQDSTGEGRRLGAEASGIAGRMADPDDDGPQRGTIEAVFGTGRRQEGHEIGRGGASLAIDEPATGPTNGRWRDADWLFCRDGKWRPVEPGTFPLAHGAPSRVGRLRAYGNAINAEAAKIFIESFMNPC